MIYRNTLVYIEKHDSEIPWIKIFSVKEYKELYDCDIDTKDALIKAMFETEKVMMEFYKPDKINIASFGNYIPLVHIHIQARFREDSYFPESMWGQKQREGNLQLPSFEIFSELLAQKMQKLFD
jgi:diadenosine tetraphosphate (Ap4A) HIT family hydrolase